MTNDNETALLKYVKDSFQGTNAFTKKPALVPIFDGILDAAIKAEPPLATQILGKISGNTENIHAYINRIRRTLDELYREEWRQQQQRVKIENIRRNGYKICVVRNDPPILRPLDYLFGNFLKPKARNLLLISEPLFWVREGIDPEERDYIRSLGVNFPSEHDLLEGIIPNPIQWSPVIHYASLAEVLGVFTFLDALTFRSAVSAGKDKTVKADRVSEPKRFMAELTTPSMAPPVDSMPRTNLIILGNPRTNTVFAEQQARLKPRFFLNRSVIWDSVKKKSYGSQVIHNNDPSSGQHKEVVTYGLLTYSHKSANGTGRTTLLIGGNYGPAVHGVCRYITDEDELQTLCPQLTTPDHALANYFQVLFKITVKTTSQGLVRIDDVAVEQVICPENKTEALPIAERAKAGAI